MNDEIKTTMRAIKANGLPPAEESSGARQRRTWLARTTTQLPIQDELDRIGKTLVAEVEALLRTSYAGSVNEHDIAVNIASVRLLRVTDFHCAIIIDVPARAIAMGDAIEVGTWGTLRAFDQKLSIADLQGIPKEFWFEL